MSVRENIISNLMTGGKRRNERERKRERERSWDIIRKEKLERRALTET